MKKQANRKAIVISAALTMLLLTFVGGGVLMVSQIFAQPIDAQSSTPVVEPSSVSRDAAMVAAPVNSATTSTSAADAATIAVDDQIIAAYQAQLEQAYTDLNDAYAQIQALQAAQSQSPAPSFFGENEHERNEQFQRDGVIVLQPRGFGDD